MPEFVPASDQSLLIVFGGEISPDVHRQVLRGLRALETAAIPGVLNLHPAYCSLLIRFDPLALDHEGLEALARSSLDRFGGVLLPEATTIEIPVRYGGECGPDLETVAALHGLSSAAVIERHSSAVYRVYFIGFVPGFAYLGGLPEQLATPRLDAPRKLVPPGSVGIAGNQTGVYPFATPGGWRLIGRTPLTLFDPGRKRMSLLEAGDRVRFIPQ